jgi:hypothetical protein
MEASPSGGNRAITSRAVATDAQASVTRIQSAPFASCGSRSCPYNTETELLPAIPSRVLFATTVASAE